MRTTTVERNGVGPDRRRGDTWVAVALLALVCALGSYWRLAHLGRENFTPDELDHYYAARSLEAGEAPLLPSGYAYHRGIDYTRLAQVSLRFVENPEVAMRLPSALLGIAGLVVIGAIAWALWGPWAAVWAALLLGIHPEAVEQARQTRFYTQQLLFALVALWAGWTVVRGSGRSGTVGRGQVLRRWSALLVTLVAFWLAARVQVTTYSLVAGWGTCVLVAAVADLRARRRQAWKDSVPLQAAVLGVIGALLLLAIEPGLPARLLERSQAVAPWVPGDGGDVRHYYWALVAAFPKIISLSPVIFLVVAVRDLRLALYLTLWFMVPFALHSFLFAWKGERFILGAVPGLLLLAAMAASVGCGFLYRWLHRRLERAGALRRRALAFGGVGVAAIGAVITTPAFNTTRDLPPIYQELHWAEAAELLEGAGSGTALTLGSSMPLPAYFYMGELDFTPALDLFAVAKKRELPDVSPAAEGLQGVRDWYSGAPTLTNPEAIRAHFPDADTIYVAVDFAKWQSHNIEEDLRQALAEEATDLCDGRCGALMLFRWIPESSSDPTNE